MLAHRDNKSEKQDGQLGPLETPRPLQLPLLWLALTQKLLAGNREALVMQRDPWVALSHPGQPTVCRRLGEQSGPTGPLDRGAGTTAAVSKPLVAERATSSLSCPCCLVLVGAWYRWDPADQLKAASRGPASPTLWDPGDTTGPLPSGAATGSRSSSIHSHSVSPPTRNLQFHLIARRSG